MDDLTPPPRPADAEPALSVVQRWFAAVITHPHGVEAGADSAAAKQMIPLDRDELERVVVQSRSLSARERLSIYANAYHTRLIECLGESYAVLKRTLGERAFNGFAFGYLQMYPPRTYTLNRLGDRFARYLDETRPKREAAAHPAGEAAAGDWPDFLIDLARLEWAIAEVFDGPGIEWGTSLKAEDLRRIPREQWPNVRLRTVPCLQLLHVRFPLNPYYTAVRRAEVAGEDEPVAVPGPGEHFIAVTRRDFIVRRHDLTRPQYELLQTLQADRPVGEAIRRAAAVSDMDDDTLATQLQRWFHHWAQSQFFEAAEEAA